MLPTLTLRQLNTAGQTQQGLVDDVSTRSLLTVRVGEGAGKLSTGLANAFVGYEAGKIHNQGSYVTFIGYQAGEQNANASYGTFVGAYAGRQNQRGNENVFVGYRTGERNISGSDCVAVGAYAMRDNASGNFSVAIGYSAGERCLDGSFNTMVGAEAGQDNRSGNFNTMTGYRSGRSAFQGNYNTYFGAYAGYSNNRGNENCFIGYRSGEALEQGNLNIAIGAYSMAKATLGHSNISIGPYSAMFNRGSGNILVGWNAGSSNYTGELNVIVGVEAGTSNQGSRNVLIGYKSASYWKGDCNVLIGSEVSQNGSGFNSVIIGYKSGGFNYRDGERNIFIGAGSDAIQSNVSDAISIGTYNVTTTSESLSIGKNIQNAGINSVSLGFSIETNAENSVLVGKDLIITSAIYFKDPLNLSLASVVLKDASEKFGIQQINYTNYVLGTSNNPHETAEFGYNTSNTFNTITLPRRNRISPDSYDLQNYMGYYAIARGCNLFYTHSSCNIAVSIEEIASKNIQSFVFYGSNIPIQSTAVIQGNTFLTNHTTSNQETFYGEVIHNSTFDIFSMILNISLFDTYQYAYPIHVAKHHAIPILHLTIPSQSISSYLLNNTPVTLNQLTSTVTFSTNGILLSSNTSFVVDTPPKYGTLNRIHVNQLNEWNYQPLRSSMFVKEDSFTIFPTTYVYDNDSNLYGISSNSVHQIQLPYQNEIILYRNDVHQPNHVIRFDCNMILWIKNGSYESTQYSNIQINGFDERYQLHYQNQIYTCNQALHQPIFQTHTLACNITVDKDNYRFVLENNPLIPLNNQLTFYIGNTYQIAQYNVSNVGYPLRFSALPEGPEYSCNVTRNGTIGTNGYLTITITNSTPNPLYYYASERPSMGGSIPIASIPTIPLSIPYDRFLNNTVYLSPLNIVSSPISPLKFKITTDTWSCNITIPFNESKNILWEDTDDTTSSIVQLTKPIVYYYGPLKTASNIFIESSTSNGILTWVNTSNSLQNIQYQPLSPWESKQDSATFLLQKSNNVQQVKRFTWNLSNVVYPIVSSNYWIDFPTSNVEISTIRVQKNNFSQTSNVSLSNTIRIEKIHYNLNQTIQSSSVQIIVQPIDSYLQSYGLSNVMSNLTIQSNIDIRLNLDHNKVIHIYENSNLFITYNQTSNTLITCNIEILQTSENDVLPHSNIVIRFKDSTVIQQSKSYNSNFDVYHNWNTTSNIYDTVSKTLIYTTQSIYPIGTSNFIQHYETPDFSNIKSFTYSNYDRQTNYNVFENLMPINRTTLFEPNTLITSVVSSIPNTYRTVLKNVGEVTTYHSSNIALGALYFKTLRPNAFGTFSTYTYTYTVGQQTKHLIIPKYSTLSTNTITIPTYRSRTNQQWIVLDSKYQGTLVNWETYARAQALLSFIPDTLYIVHCANGFISSNQEIIHRIPLANLNSSSYIYQATNRYENDTWTYFYGRESTGQCSTIYTNSIFLKYTPISSSYTISSRLSKWNPLTSNILYTTAPEEPTNLLRIQFPTLAQINTFVELYNYPNHALINNTLTWSQITSNNIYFKTKSDYAFDMETLSIDLPYRVLSSTSAILEENTLRIHVIDFTDFPQPNKSIYGVIEHLDFLENTHQTTLNGYLKSIVLNYIDKGGYLNPENLEFIITYPLQYGCLIHSDFKTQLIRRFTYNDLLLNKLVYIPYNPNEIQHDVLYFRWLFQDRISPEYNVILKNYLLKQSIYSITPYRIKDTYRQFNWKQKAILSKGLLSDISSNVVTLSPSIISYAYHSNSTFLSNVTVDFQSEFTHTSSNILLEPVAYSKPIEYVSSSIQLTIDQSDKISLKSILDSNHLRYSIEDMYHLYAYVEQSPKHGILVTNDFNNGSNLSRWTYDDLVNDNVYYHHLGSLTGLNDSFTLRFASHSYNVTLQPFTVNITILPLPKLLSNRYDILYELQSNVALNSIYPLSKSLTFNTSNAFLKVISSSNITLKSNGSNTYVFPVNFIQTNDYGYSFTSNYFQKSYGAFYENLSMHFTLSSQSFNSLPHSLALIPYYEPYFSYDWVSQLNRFENTNSIITPLLEGNTSQTIEYVFGNTSNFTDVETSFTVNVKPYNIFYENANYLTDKGKQLSKHLQTYDFEFQFINVQNFLMASFHFTESLLQITIPTLPQPYTIPINEPFDINIYGTLQIVFNDTANEYGVSVYINPDQTKSNKDNQIKNLLNNIPISIDLNLLSKVLIKSYANDANNYIETSTQKLQPVTSQLFIYQNLTHYTTRIYVRNFELFTKNINTAITSIEAETYNVVLGKAIQVKGKKNICMGTNFTTLGRNSIILGNDIGYSENSISQIYESIIIGNTSFQGSTIRGIIAIGNELMNGLIGLDEISTDAINKFIANRPVIIGNSIGPEKVDYHINIANTLMRTKIGGLRDQIYLGNEQEFVAIGYTSNVYLQGPEILFVNGGIRANRVLTDILECTGGTLTIDAVSSSNLISSNVFANLIVTDVLQCRGGTLNIDAVETSNLKASYILTDVLECAGGILTIDAVDSSNMTTSNLYAQKIITDQLEYRSGVVNLQLINSSNIYASNIIVDKITASAIEYPRGDVEFLGIVTSNVNTNNFTTSNMVVNHSFYINPNAVGNVVTEGLRATLYERLHKVFLISVETTFLTWTSEGVHFVDESDVEIFVNGMKLTYYNNNKYHFKISDIHYLNDFSQTKFDILLTDPVYFGDVVDIHIAPKLVGLSGNVYDYFAITSNVLNVKTVNEFYSPNATFSNIRILGSTIVGNNYSQKHPYQVESIHQAFINQSRTNNINIVKSGYFEASPNDVHMYINGTKLAYLTSNNTDYILTSNFSFQNQETTFTLTLDSDIIAGDIIDITLFPKAPRDQFGYFYQNFEIKTSWEDDKISLITLSNVGIGTHQPLSQFHVFGNSRFDGLLQASSIQGQLYGPWNLQSNISTSLLTIHQEHSQCNIAQFLANSKEIVTITQKGIGIGTTITQSSLHIGSNSTLLIGQHPLVSSYTAPLTIVSSNALFTNWSIDSTKSSIYEWKIGALATPSVYWTTEVTPQSEFILWNKTIQSKPFIVNHQGLVTLSNVSIIDTASISNLQTNQIITSNIWLTTSTITNTPIIQIIQPNENVTPILHASMGSNMFIVNSKGWIGIGTSPSVSIDINSTSAIQLPKGSNASRPSSNTGLIRFNIETSEFEGCYGNAWGTLGGVKSMDGSTRIETSQHLAFYTNNSERVTLMSNGNLGIGTSQPLTQLHLQGNALISGDLQVKGNLTFSNVNVLSEDVFINQDRPSIRNRLQIQPLLHKFIVPTNQYILHTETLEGLWQITPIGIDLYVNGTKWIYIDESNNDFTVTYAHIQNSNTQVNLVLATPLNSGDIMDITIWPKYISDASILQPGYILQNIYTYWNKDANCNIYYTSGNIGIGTILPKASLDVNGTLYSSNMNSITATVSNMNIPTQLTIGTHRIEKDTFTIQRTVSTPNPYLSISQLSESILYLDANGNLGIGTGLPTQKLHINGIGSSILIEDTLPTLQLKHTSLNTIWKLQLNASQNRLDIIDNSIPRLSFLGNGNIGIGTTLPNEKIHIEGGCFVSKSIRTPTFVTSNINVDDFIVISSNAFIGGKLQINNQLPQTALKITQLNSNAPLSSFYTSSSYPALHITSNGWIGIGTEIPYSSFHISTKDSLLLPVGSTEDRPIKASVGHIRYNTTLQQFEGYGSNEVWGSLGGIRSSDRKTYISAESYPGTNDCNLRFYTNDILQATLNPFGNVGIGTTNITHKLRVEGDAYVSGTITTPYMNITNAIFYNEDSPALRNRLQLAPTQLIQIINQDNLNQFQIIINGVWMIHSQKVHIHVNGYKLVYLDASNRDYTIDFQHINQNTQVTITLDNSLYIGDVLDISIWPSYYNENALNQSGIVIQNFNYSIWSSNMANANITYNNGNVGIGTTIATHKMSINGNTLIRGELSLYRNRYHTGGIFGTEFFPINGGTIIYDLNVYDNAIIELSSINLTLTIDFSNITQNIGKTVTIIIIERSNSNRNIVIDSFVKFANSRPFIIKALSTSKLTITVIKSNLILGEYDTDIASF